jgi:hypothetical protein
MKKNKKQPIPEPSGTRLSQRSLAFFLVRYQTEAMDDGMLIPRCIPRCRCPPVIVSINEISFKEKQNTVDSSQML